MVNGFGIAHGGIAFSFADSALAFASNAYGRLSVALECSVSFAIPVNVNDELTCEAKELSLTNRTATYHIEISNQKKEKAILLHRFLSGWMRRVIRYFSSFTAVSLSTKKINSLIVNIPSVDLHQCCRESMANMSRNYK